MHNVIKVKVTFYFLSKKLTAVIFCGSNAAFANLVFCKRQRVHCKNLILCGWFKERLCPLHLHLRERNLKLKK